MPPVLLAIITAIAALYLVFGPLRSSFAILVGATFLVPSVLRPPGVHSAYFSIHRLLLLAFVLNLFIKVLRRKSGIDAFRPTRLHLALLAYLVLSFVIGVVLGDIGVPITVSVYSWTFVVDQLVIFSIAVAMIRTTGDVTWLAKLLASVAVLIAGIAIIEHFTHWSYAEWMFKRLPAQAGAPGNFPLEVRGGDVRVRAAADFSLAYAWIGTALLPIVMAVAARAQRRIAFVLPSLIAVSVVWTYARTAYVGMGIVIGVLIVATRFARRVVVPIAVGVVAAALLFAFSPAVTRAFRASDVPGSSEVREQRLPVVFRDAAQRPFTGVGIATLSFSQGIKSTDASYLATYADLGVVGLVALVLLFGFVLQAVTPTLIHGPPGPELALAGGVLAAIVGGIMAAAVYDELTVSASYRLFWLLAALGVGLAERVPVPTLHKLRRATARLGLPLLGAGLGVIVAVAAPRHGVVMLRFNSLNAGVDVAVENSLDFPGRTMTNTICHVMQAAARETPGTAVACYDLRTGAGVGEARIQAHDLAQADQNAKAMIERAKKAVPWLRTYVVEKTARARPTWARTAPVWMAGIGLALALFLPPIAAWRPRRQSVAFPQFARAT